MCVLQSRHGGPQSPTEKEECMCFFCPFRSWVCVCVCVCACVCVFQIRQGELLSHPRTKTGHCKALPLLPVWCELL